MNRFKHSANTLIIASSAIAITCIGVTPASAQKIEADNNISDTSQSPQEIVITGSRIARRDYTANSPIVTVGTDLLDNTSSSAVETSLNKLPEFSPAQTPALGSDIQPTATNTPGAASVSLRGIGANRNLVLIDGRRATPGNANMVVDTNSIPSAAIDRVEVISGGASATYGADAVGGVVNFILKKNFQGLQLDGRYGISQRGDGQEYKISGIMGTDFADQRGNISIAFETNDRAAALRRDRPWFVDNLLSPQTGGTQTFASEPSFVPGVVRPSQAAMNSIFSGRDVTVFANYPVTGTVYVNTNGTVFGGVDYATRAGTYRYAGTFDLHTKKTTIGTIAENYTNEQLVLPLNRWNMYLRGNYELTDWVSVVAQGYFNGSQTHTTQMSPVAGNGWSANIPVANHPVPPELAAILASRTPLATASKQALSNLNCPATANSAIAGSGAQCDWQLNQYPTDLNRMVSTDVFTYQMLAGFEGKVPGTDWTWDITGSRGVSETNFILDGYISLQRYRDVIRSPNWGQGLVFQGNQVQGGFGAATATCTSGLNPFDNIATSQDCIDAISATLKQRSFMVQSNWEANAQGTLFDLPAGQLKGAIGASYRRNTFSYLNDTLSTQGVSFDDQANGIYPSGNTKGVVKVKELYSELLIPVVKDAPLIKEFSLELGARISDYSTTGGSFTWKALANLQVTNWLRFRGGFNRAERAPNIAELFQSQQQTFANLPKGDICSTANNLVSYGAGPANTSNRAAVQALCVTLMNSIDPSTSSTFYAGGQVAGATTGFVSSVGNSNLTPESAKTWTAGMVVNSPFNMPILSDMNVTVDYYRITVDNAIGAQTGDYIQQKCFDVAYNPTLNPNSPACQNVVRNPSTGAIANLIGGFSNAGRFRTSGLDAQVNWQLNFQNVGIGLPGRLSISSVLNYLFEMKTSPSIDSPLVDYAGTLGSTENGLNSGNGYRWKLLTTFGYSVDRFNLSLQWQHLPSVRSASYAVNSNTTTFGAPAYDIFNLSGRVSITKGATLRAGIDNLFDKAPPLVNFNTAADNSAGQLRGGALGTAGTQIYDLIGRRIYIGVNFKL